MTSAGSVAGRVATWVGQIELSDTLGVVPVDGDLKANHAQARIWVRLHGIPLGFLEIDIANGFINSGAVTELALSKYLDKVEEHLATDDFQLEDGIDIPLEIQRQIYCDSQSAPQIPISVIVATKNRPNLIGDTLGTLANLDYPTMEVLLIDGSLDETTRRVFEEVVGSDERFRFVSEPAPGLSRARNVGMELAKYDIVAFTDDDCRCDPLWLRGIAKGFSRDSNVSCVTGIVPSSQLNNAAQHYFDGRVWWAATVEAKIHRPYRQSGDSPLHPFRMGTYGTGANFALDKDIAIGLGGFSELLGAGSPCKGGAEDGDMYVRVLRAGRSIAFEPSAIVWHRGRETQEKLDSQMFEYGRGISVTALKWLSDPELRLEVVRRMPIAIYYWLSLLWTRGYSGEKDRAGFAIAEFKGMLTGPAAFLRGRAAVGLHPERKA